MSQLNSAALRRIARTIAREPAEPAQPRDPICPCERPCRDRAYRGRWCCRKCGRLLPWHVRVRARRDQREAA